MDSVGSMASHLAVAAEASSINPLCPKLLVVLGYESGVPQTMWQASTAEILSRLASLL